MLTIDAISKSYGPFQVLDTVSFSLNRGMRAGLVGGNGAGKSTLIKIIAGVETADSGNLFLVPETRIGYLPQSLSIEISGTVGDIITGAAGEVRATGIRMREIEREMTAATGSRLDELIDDYGAVCSRFEELGGYDLDYREDIVLNGLAIGYLERTRPVATLSGGERTRLGLAVLLLRSPDLLLLDEPTNNLDAAALDWLETYLADYPGAVLMASHDRQLLSTAANWIFDIDEHTRTLTRYPGNYDDYKSVRELERVKWEESYEQQQDEIRELKRVMKSASSDARKPIRTRDTKDNDKFIAQFKGERTQAAATRNLRSARERLQRIMKDPIPKPPKPLRFKAAFTGNEIKSSEIISAEGLTKKYGDKVILKDLRFTLGPGKRVVITGGNGTGKTTLLRLLTGREQPDSGGIVLAPGVRLGYLPQEPEDADSAMTVLDYYRRDLAGHEDDFIFSLVTCGLFGYDEIRKSLGELSLGQVRKLEIARLIAAEPNVLILDEPTNHLALDILESFEAAIVDFPGPVLAVSHERRFLQRFGSIQYKLENGQLLLQ